LDIFVSIFDAIFIAFKSFSSKQFISELPKRNPPLPIHHLTLRRYHHALREPNDVTSSRQEPNRKAWKELLLWNQQFWTTLTFKTSDGCCGSLEDTTFSKF
jgi:hypothetical protein